MTTKYDPDYITQVLGTLTDPGQVVEVRILGAPKAGTVSGFFNDPQVLAKAVAGWDGKGEAVYMTLNPVNPDLLARSANRLRTWAKNLTTDADIVARRWLLVDIDAERASGISASDNELQRALARRDEVADWLSAAGWPAPLRAMSGNGGHLLYRLPDLPNDRTTTALVETCLKVLAERFGGNGVAIDTNVANPARLMKVYGTVVCKGDHLPERPHRRSNLALPDEPPEPVSLELLRWVAGHSKAGGGQVTGKNNGGLPILDVRGYLTNTGLAWKDTGPDAKGRHWYNFEVCPVHPNAQKHWECGIAQDADGKLYGRCQHDHRKGWQDFKAVLGDPRRFYQGGSDSLDIGQTDGKTVRAVQTVRTGECTDGSLQHLQRGIADLFAIEGNDVEWVIPQFLHRNGITIMGGLPGVGKTTFGVELSYRLATGDNFLAERVERAKVIWLSFEHSAGSLKDKHEKLGDIPEGWLVYQRDPLPLTVETLDAYTVHFLELGAHVAIVDTFADWLALEDMDRTGIVREAMALVRELCDKTGVAILAIGHPTKQATLTSVYALANSYVFSAKSDIIAILVDVQPSDISGGQNELEYAELRVLKNRHGEGAWSVTLLKQRGCFKPLTAETRPLTIYDKIVSFIRGQGGLVYWQSFCDFFKAEGSERRLRRKVDRLVQRRSVSRGYDRGNKNRLFLYLPGTDLNKFFDADGLISLGEFSPGSSDSSDSSDSFTTGVEDGRTVRTLSIQDKLDDDWEVIE